jgi:hypothetical protein
MDLQELDAQYWFDVFFVSLCVAYLPRVIDFLLFFCQWGYRYVTYTSRQKEHHELNLDQQIIFSDKEVESDDADQEGSDIPPSRQNSPSVKRPEDLYHGGVRTRSQTLRGRRAKNR